MLPLLERAQSMFRRSRNSPAPQPQAYESLCPAGHSVRGSRATRYQAVECPECRSVVFVLPLSPLPPLEAPPLPQPIPVRRRRRRRGARWRVRLKAAHRRLSDGLRTLKPPPRWLARERLIVLAVLLVLVGTGAVLLTRHRRGNLRATLHAQLALGRASLDRGEFEAAAQQLRLARDAAESLGPEATGAIAALQAAREADVLADLAVARLDSIAREALAAWQSGNRDDWLAEFRVLYEGKAFLFDGLVTPKPLADRTGYQFDLVLFEGDRRFEVDVSSLELLRRLDLSGPQRLVFGARLVAVEPTIVEPSRWMFRLRPDSGVLVARWEVFEPLGWEVDEELTALIESQRAWADRLSREDLQ